jgi:hypothetical protein
MCQLSEGKNNVIPPHHFTKWQMDNSQLFTKVNIEESKKAAKSVGAGLKQCYYNCWRLLTPLQYKYFEGFVCSKQFAFPIEHAWLVNKKGEVVDPTLILHTEKIGEFDEKRLGVGGEYLGIEIPVEFALKLGFKQRKSGPYIPYYYSELYDEKQR